MDEKLKYGSVIMMLVSAKSTWIYRIQREGKSDRMNIFKQLQTASQNEVQNKP